MKARSSVEAFDTMTGAEIFVYEIEALREGDATAANAALAYLDAQRSGVSELTQSDPPVRAP